MVGPFGTFEVKLDDKGRLVVPAKARATLADCLYLAAGRNNCLYLFSESQFKAHRDALANSVPDGMDATEFERLFFSHVRQSKLDAQSRLPVPQKLRDYAGLTSELAVIGLPGRLEIWDIHAWTAYQARFEALFSGEPKEVS